MQSPLVRLTVGMSACVVGLVVSAGVARAQGVEASVYRPASPGAASFVTEDARPLPAGAWNLGLGLDVARDATVHVGASVGLPAGFELGAQLPLALDSPGSLTMSEDGALQSRARATENLALRGKFCLLDWESVQLATAVSGEVPLGEPNHAGPVLALRLLAGASLGSVDLSLAAGHRWRERAMVGNQWVAELGASVPVIDRRLWLVGDGQVAVAVAAQGSAERQVAADLLGGARVRIVGPWVAQAGIGVGLTHGDGAPGVRGLALFAWSPDRTVLRRATTD